MAIKVISGGLKEAPAPDSAPSSAPPAAAAPAFKVISGGPKASDTPKPSLFKVISGGLKEMASAPSAQREGPQKASTFTPDFLPPTYQKKIEDFLNEPINIGDSEPLFKMSEPPKYERDAEGSVIPQLSARRTSLQGALKSAITKPFVRSVKDEEVRRTNIDTIHRELNPEMQSPYPGVRPIQNPFTPGRRERITKDEIKRNYDDFAMSLDLIGPTKSKILEDTMTGAAAVGLMTAPGPIAMALAGFAGMTELDRFVTSQLTREEYKPLSSDTLADKITPENASENVKFAIELGDFFLKGKVLHGLSIKAPEIVEAMTKTKVERYNLPRNINIPKETVFDYLQSGKTEPNTKGILDDLEMSKEQKVRALKEGIDIKVPTEKFVMMADRPWFASLKRFLNVKETPEVRVGERVEKPTEALKQIELQPSDAPAQEVRVDVPAEKAQTPDIPKFKGTKDAVSFGQAHADHPEVLAALQSRLASLQPFIDALKGKKDMDSLQKGMDLAVEKQFYNEALQAARGDIGPQDIPSPEKVIKAAEKAPFKDFSPAEVLDRKKSDLFDRGQFYGEKLKTDTAGLRDEIAGLQTKLDDTEQISERAGIKRQMEGIRSKITAQETAVDTKLNADSEAVLSKLSEYAQSHEGLRWPRAREKDFRRQIMANLTNDLIPGDKPVREIVDSIIQEYAAIDRARAASPIKPKTVGGYIKAAGGIDPASIEAAGFNVKEDFIQNGAGYLLKQGGQQFDALANSIMDQGAVPHVEGESPMQTVINAIKARRLLIDNMEKSVDKEIYQHEQELADQMEDYQNAKSAGLVPEGESPEPSIHEIETAQTEGQKEAASIDEGQPTAKLTLQYGNANVPVSSLKDASNLWQDIRDKAMKEGGHSRDMEHTPVVVDAKGNIVAEISWNGKIINSIDEGNEPPTVKAKPEIVEVDGKKGVWVQKNGHKVFVPTASSLEKPKELYRISDIGFFSHLEKVIEEKMPNSASPDQVRGILKNSGTKQEEQDWLGIDQFLEGKEKVSKKELLDFIASNNVQVQEVVKGQNLEKINLKSKYAIPEVVKLAKEWQGNAEDALWMVLANDGDAYRALTKKFPELAKNENWASIVADDVYGGGDNVVDTKFSSYQLPGGENYKELLLTLPTELSGNQQIRKESDGTWSIYENGEAKLKNIKTEEAAKSQMLNREKNFFGGKDIFRSSHFDEPNVLAHIRFNERTDADGKKVLFIEEVQSDWHQKGRKEGYQQPNDLPIEEEASIDPDGNPVTRYRIKGSNLLYATREGALRDLQDRKVGVPNAPFKKTWHELALKRMLRYAAENGFDKIAWTTGEQQAERYDLSKHADFVLYEPANKQLVVENGREKILDKRVEPQEIESILGKEVARRLLETPAKVFKGDRYTQQPAHVLHGEDLKVGGEGMKGFYDQIIPAFLNKYTKKWGGKVSSLEISMPGEGVKSTKDYYIKKVSDDVFWVMLKGTEEGGPLDQFGTKGLAEQFIKSLSPNEIKVHSLEITDPMKKSVIQEGQPLFRSNEERNMIRSGELVEHKAALKTIEEGRALVKELVPHVNLQTVSQITGTGGKDALGVFIKVGESGGLIKTVERAGLKVYAHEIAHAARLMYLTEAESIDLLQEVKNKWGAQDDTDADEMLARGYEEYRQKASEGKSTEQILGKKLTDKIRAFFKRMFEAIKKWVQAGKNKETFDKIKAFYQNLSEGVYARRGPARSAERGELFRTPSEGSVPDNGQIENPIFAERERTPQEDQEIKGLQEELRKIMTQFKQRQAIGQSVRGVEERRDFLINELNRAFSPKNRTESSQELQKHIAQQDFFDTEVPPGGTSLLAGIDHLKLKDLNGLEAAGRDIFRNLMDVFGDQFPLIEKRILDAMDKSRSKWVDMRKAWTDELNATIQKKLGILSHSKENSLVQKYGEGERFVTVKDENGKKKRVKMAFTYDDLVGEVGKAKADKIVEADSWFRTAYDEILPRVNDAIAKIYPGQSQRLIPRRRNYYRHFFEFPSLAGFMHLFDGPSNLQYEPGTLFSLLEILLKPSAIPASLAGISEFTKPKSRLLAFAQQRLGIKTKYDAIGGFLDYLNAAAYAIHISPNIPVVRQLAKELRILTEPDKNISAKISNLYESRRLEPDAVAKQAIMDQIYMLSKKNYLNNFIGYLDNFAGDLAGKTNPYFEREFQRLFGRKAVSVTNWINSRTKANLILGNPRASLVSQFFSLPLMIGDTKFYTFQGIGETIAQLVKPDPEMLQDQFIKSRYAESMFDKFDRGWVADIIPYPAKVKNVFNWAMSVTDEIAVKIGWNSYRAKARAKGINDPAGYAGKQVRLKVAGRSVGEVPLVQRSKMFQLVGSFTLEMQNANWELGDKAKARDFSYILVFLIINWIANEIAEKLTGHRVTMDPLNAAVDAFTGDKTPAQRFGRVVGEFLSNVPMGTFAESFYSAFAEANPGVFPTARQFFGEADTTRFGKSVLVEGLTDPVFKLIPPFGGNQIKNINKATRAFNDGYVSVQNHKVWLHPHLMDKFTGYLFGPYALPDVKEYFKDQKAKSQYKYMLKH